MPLPRNRKLLLGLAVILAVGVGVWYWRAPEAAPPPVGIVRATEIRVAPEVSGRLSKVLVAAGQTIHRGEPIALLDSPELWAAVIEARAQVEKAKSDRDRVYAGVRQEEVAVLQREILKAQAARLLASQELQRKAYLATRSDVSQQEADIAQAAWSRADADVAVAEARYAEAKLGPTTEERALADAQVTAAEAARDVIEAHAAKMLLHAPAPGVIGTLVAELGEAIRPGETILTVLPDQGAWFGFDVREDRLGDVTVGTSVALTGARLKEPITAKVSELRNWGEFATWRAARASGDHDLNTFFLRLDPITRAVPLEPGQTVWLGELK